MKLQPKDKDILINLFASGLSVIEIAAQLHISQSRVYQILDANNIARRFRYHVDESFFGSIDTEQKAYWLGFLYADGWVYKKGYTTQLGVELNICDAAHLEKFLSDIHGTYPLSYRKSRPMVRLTVNSPVIVADLIRHGMVQRKSLILTFPHWLTVDLIRHFIRGYFDGDGSMHIVSPQSWNGTTQPQMTIAGTTNMLVEIRTQLSKIDGVGFPAIPTEKVWSVLSYGGGKQVPSILRWLYDDCTVCLTRKRDSAHHIIATYNHNQYPQISKITSNVPAPDAEI